MLRNITKFSTNIAVLLILATSAHSQEAQTSFVVVIDFQHITRESKSGLAVRKKVNELHAIYQKEIKSRQISLEIERKKLKNKQENLSEEKFQILREKYKSEAALLQQLVQERKRQIDEMYVIGMRKIESTLSKIIQEISLERKIDLILNITRGKGIVIYANSRTNLTSEVKKRLNDRLPTISLTVPPLLKESEK